MPSTIGIVSSHQLPKVSVIQVLVVAGGGGGGGNAGGGGGAGGFRYNNTLTITQGNTYTCTIGTGGAKAVNNTTRASSGVNSSISGTGITTITSSGGGGAASRDGGSNSSNGGSGAGGAGVQISPGRDAIGTGNSGAYSPSEGNNGGLGIAKSFGNPDFTNVTGGGGGGASSVGGNAAVDVPGNGGTGSEWPTSSATYYAGGGGGGNLQDFPNANSTGGTGGGGRGYGNSGAADNGTVNTGGGGGGGGNTAGNGGSGVTIIRYSNVYRDATSTTGSPTFTNTGGFKEYKFTATGTIVF